MKESTFTFTYWKLQGIGWFLFFIIMIEERIRYDEDFIGMAFVAFLIALVGFVCTLFLRWFYGKIKTDQLPFPMIIILMVVSSVIIGFLWANVTAFYINKFALLTPERTPDWYRMSAWERNLIVIIFLWNSMYFGIKYWRKSLEENTKRLQAEFDAEKSKMEQVRFQKELDYKNKELMTKTMYLAKHNDLLITISNLIESQKSATSSETILILAQIKASLKIEDQWKEFDLWFKDVHYDFYDQLREKYPELSPREMKICAFLKLKLSTKEMADLTNLTIGTIEQYRSKLRKKFQLSDGENIHLFLDSL